MKSLQLACSLLLLVPGVAANDLLITAGCIVYGTGNVIESCSVVIRDSGPSQS